MDNDKFVMIRMNPELHVKFKVHCVLQKVSMADKLKELVEQELEK